MEKSIGTKAVIELNWKILLVIIGVVVFFIIIFLLMSGFLNKCSMGVGARDICFLIISKLGLFGIGAEKMEICEAYLPEDCR
jgi:TRAP-type uncharacterized transport system fused permease subunit